MKTKLLIAILLAFSFSVYAEGTKELMPNNMGKCYVQFNESVEGQRYFAMPDADSLHRLYIHIANVGEVIHMGFNGPTSLLLGNPLAQFRIKDPTGKVVYGFENIPTSGNDGYISSWSQADIGPNTLIGGSGGYTPLSYTTETTGDFYIEFEKTSSPNARYLFEYFDITVGSTDNNPIKGRVWAYAWDLNTNSFSNKAYPVFYVYSDDKYITRININGMQPYSFVIACNNTGSRNTGDLSIDRQSVPYANTTYPKYKIFLNHPDPDVYDVAEIPTMTAPLSIKGTPVANQPVEFFINMTKSGTLEIFLDIDDKEGYQTGGRDVALVQHIKAGGDTIVWDGLDGLGEQVTSTVTVLVTSKFATGVTHLPVYDAEKNEHGFLVSRIAPEGPEDLVLYWDDSQIPHGDLPVGQQLEMFAGNTLDNGHKWTTGGSKPNGFGDEHTINTWWNGYENNDLSSFNFTFLPIELAYWHAENKGTYVQLSWTTASETNNHLFHVQRSSDGKEWKTISTIVGAGTSTTSINYHEIDEEPIQNMAYYRLQQVDFDGKCSFSRIIAVGTSIETNKKYTVYSYYGATYIDVNLAGVQPHNVSITDLQGRSVVGYVTMNQLEHDVIKINISYLPPAAYILRVGNFSSVFYVQ